MKKLFALIMAGLMALCPMLLTGCEGLNNSSAQKDGFAVALAAKREFTKNPFTGTDYNEARGEKWAAEWAARRQAAEKVPDISAFSTALAQAVLASRGASSTVFSPLNIYVALALLAEVTGGETQEEILSVLGAEDIASLRTGVEAILTAESMGDGVVTSNLANSVWLNKSLDYNEEPLRRLAEIYSASSFSGDPGDPAFKKAIADWIDENTGGLLKDASGNIRPGSVFTLVSTIYFKAPWAEKFSSSETEKELFHAPGGDVECSMMHLTELPGLVYQGEGFTAVRRDFSEGGGSMWLLLPEEGLSPEAIASAGLNFVASSENAEGVSCKLHLAMPRLDVSSDLDLIPVLQEMGIQKCFGGGDFSPLVGDADAYVSRVQHAARIKADEEGAEAAAFTAISADGCAFIEEGSEYWFTLDRPFLLIMTGVSGEATFVSAVNNPTEG